MQKLIDFLEKHMTKAVFTTIIFSLFQVFSATGQSTPIPEDVLKQVAASSSGLQSVMLIVLYFFLKMQQKK